MQSEVDETAARVTEARQAAADAFATWIATETSALSTWTVGQTKAFVTNQHEVSARLGREGVAALRERATRLARDLSAGVPTAYAELQRHDGAATYDRKNATERADDFRDKYVQPLADLLMEYGYKGERGFWRHFDWYALDEKRKDTNRGKIDLPLLTALTRAYQHRLDALRAAVDAHERAIAAAKRAAAADLWGD